MARLGIMVQSFTLALILLGGGFLIDRAAGYNAFSDHIAAIPLILATFTPWAALFVFVAGLWATYVDLFFQRRAGKPDQGLAHELCHDNSAAAALLVTMPIAILAVLFLAIATLTR